MESNSKANKIMEDEPRGKTPAKRGRKKKSEMMKGAEDQLKRHQTVQNIRRSLRGKNIEAIQGEILSNVEELSLNEEQNTSIRSKYIENSSHANNPPPNNVEIDDLDTSLSRCELIDDTKYPIVLLHQLTNSDISPKKESMVPEGLVLNDESTDNEICIKMEISNDEFVKESFVPENYIHSEEEKIKVEPMFEQQSAENEKEDRSCLRRSRRLKSIYIETSIIEATETQKIEPVQHVSLQEKITNLKELEVKLEGDVINVKNEEHYETIDVENDARLSQFVTIKDNIYLKPSDKVICKINKTMKCDCTITEDEIKNGELGCTFNCINRLLYIECSPKCRCGEFCDNQQFQRYNYSPISVFKTEKKGFGIRADADIPPETFIIEYVGEVLNNKQFEKRANKYSKDKNRHYYFMALRSNAVIDATVKGNISRFINHSCDPNAITQKWTINGELRVGFFSVRFIKKGEEITFDYQFQRYGKEAQRCWCESDNCRGWIGENPESDEEISLENLESTKDKKGAIKTKKVLAPSKTKLKIKSVESAEMIDEIKEIEIKKMETVIKSDKKPKKLYEDLEIEEQIKDLIKSGLKNRAHTISLARLVVRAKSVESRSSILKILIAGELPCRRLFLDYNGLKLLHTWMCDISIKSSIPDICLCIELLNALSLLPITNKTVLRDSKVLERVEKWKNLNIERKKLTKEEKKQAKAFKKKNKTNFQDQSTSETLKDEVTQFTQTYDVLEELPTMKLVLKEKAASLLQKWEVLKEDFRIPKKQKQENRKEHEKEAGMEEDLWKDFQAKANHQKIRNRFGHEINTNRNAYNNAPTSSSSQYQPSSTHYRRYLDPLEKQHRRKQFEKQELEKRMWAEHENNCAIFGLPNDTPLTNIPVKVNRVTGECYQIFGNRVPCPPNFHEFKYEPLTLSTNPDDYHLPPIDLPEHWRFAIDKYGRLYYYHEKIRISQWEAPIKILPLFSNDDNDDDEDDEMNFEKYENSGTPDDGESSTDTEDSEEEELCSLLDMLKRKKRKLNGHINFEQISAGISDISAVEEDLEKRIKLNCSISKRLDDPVKILPVAEGSIKRKKRRGLVTMMKFIRPRTEEDKLYGRNESRRYKEVKEKLRRLKKKRLHHGESSGDTSDVFDEDEEDVDDAGFSGKMVDELDILAKSKHLEKIRKIKSDVDFLDPTKMKKQITRPMPPSDQSLIKRQFRDDIKDEIAKYLLPYRTETCINGKIESDDDYNSLVNKLTFSVLTKESKHCALNNSMLKATDSVKGKTKEFIKKYMSKFEGAYRRKADEQDYSLILNKY